MSSVKCAVKTLLVVEDRDAERDALAMLLRGAGYRVATAADGLEALVQLRAGLVPDLILLDMFMPALDGAHVLDELKRLAGAAAVPVVVTTGAALTPEWAAGRGCAGFLRKPVDPDELFREVARCLRS